MTTDKERIENIISGIESSIGFYGKALYEYYKRYKENEARMMRQTVIVYIPVPDYMYQNVLDWSMRISEGLSKLRKINSEIADEVDGKVSQICRSLEAQYKC